MLVCLFLIKRRQGSPTLCIIPWAQLCPRLRSLPRGEHLEGQLGASQTGGERLRTRLEFSSDPMDTGLLLAGCAPCTIPNSSPGTSSPTTQAWSQPTTQVTCACETSRVGTLPLARALGQGPAHCGRQLSWTHAGARHLRTHVHLRRWVCPTSFCEPCFHALHRGHTFCCMPRDY